MSFKEKFSDVNINIHYHFSLVKVIDVIKLNYFMKI
jgi:hypothetical protein